jgi:hypothetical protein
MKKNRRLLSDWLYYRVCYFVTVSFILGQLQVEQTPLNRDVIVNRSAVREYPQPEFGSRPFRAAFMPLQTAQPVRCKCGC